MQKKNNTVFEIADRLRELLAEREDAARIVREIDGEITVAKALLFEAMKKADTQGITRGGVRFYLIPPRNTPEGLGIRKATGGAKNAGQK